MSQLDQAQFDEFVNRRCASIDRNLNGMMLLGGALIVATIGAFGFLFYSFYVL